MKTLKYLWQTHRLLLLGFTAATLVTLVFAVRFTLSVIYWSDHQDVVIEPWMPIGYIAQSYRVDRAWLLQQTGLTRDDIRRRESIGNIAESAGVEFDRMRTLLLTAIEAKRAE